MRNPLTGNKGVGLIAAVLIMLIMSVMGLTVASLVATDTSVSVNYLQSQQALYLAESCIQARLLQIKGGTPWNSGWSCSQVLTNPGGDPNLYQIVSTGSVSGAVNTQRVITAVYQKGGTLTNVRDGVPLPLLWILLGYAMPTLSDLKGFNAVISNSVASGPAGLYYYKPSCGTTVSWGAGTTLSGILFVDGDLDIPPGAGGSFNGIIVVRGNYTNRSNSTSITNGIFPFLNFLLSGDSVFAGGIASAPPAFVSWQEQL